MFENPKARNFPTNIPKILDLNSFSENWRWVPQFDIKIEKHSLKRAKPYMRLGFDLDESLSRDSLLHNIVKKVSAGLRAIIRVRNHFPRETLIMIHKALIQPCFDYCSSFWGSLGVCQSERLQKLKNRPYT